MHSVPAQSDHTPKPSSEPESHLPNLSERFTPSDVPCSDINIVGPTTMPDISQLEFDDPIAPSGTLSLSTGALQHPRGVLEDHANPDEHISYQADSRSTIQESPIDSRKSHGSEPRTAAVSLDSPSFASHATPLQDKSDWQSTHEPPTIASTAVPSDRASTAGVDLPISQETVVSLPRMPLRSKLT
jgi:hypothetical protein